MKSLLKILTLVSVLFPLHAVAATSPFVDAAFYFAHNTSYAGSIASLAKQFDDICGDTFCEGEYSNLTSLGIDCSINQQSGALGQCYWTFAGSYADVDAGTGHIQMSHDLKTCGMPIQGNAQDLLAFLTKAASAGHSLHDGLYNAVVPGDSARRTLYEVLASCL